METKMTEEIKKCCPSCGSTTTTHNSWCDIHETDSSVFANRLRMQREVFNHRHDRKWLKEHFGEKKR